MEKDRVFEEIYEFIRKSYGTKIHTETSFFDDLELIGDDAYFFLLRFQKRFDVNFDDFVFDNYFLPEFQIPFQYWYYKKFKPDKLKRKTFTIQHLVEVVNRGKWFDPI